jgi:hypothetical protein
MQPASSRRVSDGRRVSQRPQAAPYAIDSSRSPRLESTDSSETGLRREMIEYALSLR